MAGGQPHMPGVPGRALKELFLRTFFELQDLRTFQVAETFEAKKRAPSFQHCQR